MGTLSNKQIQQAITKDDLKIKPMDKQHKKEYINKNQNYQGDFGFGKKKWYSNKINFEILSYNIVRLAIVILTSISLMELERAL